MKDKREDIYFNTEDKKMLASNLAASLNIPPDITITAVSVPSKPMTPPLKSGYQNNAAHLNSSSPSIPMNIPVNSPINLNINNQNSPLNLNANSCGNSSNRSSPMNFSLNSPSNQVTMSPSSTVNSLANNQKSALNLNNQNNQVGKSNQNAGEMSPINVLPDAPGNSKYSQLLDVIEEIGKDVRPTYSGSRSSAERLRRSIGLARILIRQCIMETEPNIKQ